MNEATSNVSTIENEYLKLCEEHKVNITEEDDSKNGI